MITRMLFGDLPIGARFGWEGWGRTIIYVKTAKRKYAIEDSDKEQFDKSPGVMVDCIEDPLRLAVLTARQNRNAESEEISANETD